MSSNTSSSSSLSSITMMILSLMMMMMLLLGQSSGSRVITPTTTTTTGVLDHQEEKGCSFIERKGNHFVKKGEENNKAIYLNGFNAYWLMYMGSDPLTKNKVSSTFQKASKYGMNVCRTWAFSDGVSFRPLQKSPGSYNQEMFQGLDYVISEARKEGVYLILSLVNNWDDFGGKKQYVQWVRDEGHYLNNDDDFFTNPIAKQFYKNHIKTVLNRVNTITGIAYKDDPAIFAWELMNEPRCQSDLSGKSIQDWTEEMAAYLKSIDGNHLLQIGLEGFYGPSMPERTKHNPGYEVGTDFISNNLVKDVDFATIHLYPDQWKPSEDEEGRAEFVKDWIEAHIEDSQKVLGKPIVLSEFGKSSRTTKDYNVGMRDKYFGELYDNIYECARNGGPCGGGLFWQVMAEEMEGWADGYEVLLDQSPSTVGVIAQQSRRLSNLS